jgi:kynurenine formamidase
MCFPLCLEALYGSASRRGFVRKSMMAAAVVCGARAASGAAVATPAAQQPRTFTTVLDLTHPLYEGFPTFDGSKWFTMEKKFTFAKEKLNINTWPINDFVVPLAVVDISQRAQDDPDTALTPDDLKQWEAANGPLPEAAA